MKTEWQIFGGVSGFFLIAGIVYGWWTWYDFGELEWIGTTALMLSFLLTGMCGMYFWIISRRIEPRPEDRHEAEISEGAGVVGFFSPGSYFPVAMALFVTVGGLGLAFWQWWLIIAGIIGTILTSAGLLFEYQTGTRRTAEQ